MAAISSGILGDANLLNLKEMPASQIRSEAASFFVPGEEIIQCFKTIRDQVIFTNKRVFVTMDELWWLIETKEKYGKTYMMAENNIYTPEVQLVKRLRDAGKFGTPFYAEGEYLRRSEGKEK